MIPCTRTLAAPLAVAVTLAAPLSAQAADRLTPEQRQELEKLQPKIDAAIDKAVGYLLGTQLRDGSWGYDQHLFASGQTALCAYTLMKAGLPPDHAAVRRALTFLQESRPTMVYAAGCQMLAFAEARDGAYLEPMRHVLRDLLGWQQGSWGYPNSRAENPHLHTDQDLSITQFAVLGLRSAARAGLEVPVRAWQDVLESALDYQEKARPVEVPVTADRHVIEREAAGFHYRRTDRKASGSMTTAGIAVLAIARDGLGAKLGRRLGRDVDRAIELGLAWLGHRYTVDENPGRNREWYYYYLYGLERVGSLLGIEMIDGHPWYLDGAKKLVADQKTDGSWSQRHAEPDTCFAVLFLKRATAPTTGVPTRTPFLSLSEAQGAGVWLRGAGGVDGSPLNLWLTRVGKQDRDGKVPALRVERVEYLVDGAVVAIVAGHPSRPWRDDVLVARHVFERSGTYLVSARVHAFEPSDDPYGEPTPITLEAEGFKIAVDHVLEPWMLEAARAAPNDLLAGVAVDARASSIRQKGNEPGKAADGLESTGWYCDRDDAEPWLELRLGRPVRAGTIVLGQGPGRRNARGHFDRIERVRLVVNRGLEIEVELEPDEMRPTRIALPRPTRIGQLRITILARTKGEKHPGSVGFSEILLLD